MKRDEEKHEDIRDSTRKPFWKRYAVTCVVASVAAVIVLAAVVPAATERSAQEPENPSAAVSESASAATNSPGPTFTASAAARATPAESGTSVPAAEPQWEYADFSNSVFIGSSTTEALYIYNLLDGADYICGTGLTVDTVRTKPMTGGKVAAIDELAGKNYNQVFLAFGLNELGWPDDAVFCQMYADVIARVRQYLPTAAIYIESVLPVGIETSKRGRFGVTQDRINQFNAMLEQFAAEQGVHFINVSEELKGPDGYLPGEAAVDGIHPNLEWAGKWVHLIRLRTEEVLNAASGATPPPQYIPEAPAQEEQQVPADPAADTADATASVPDPADPGAVPGSAAEQTMQDA